MLATLYCHGRSSYWNLYCALRSLDRCVVRTVSSSNALARSCRDWNVLARKSHWHGPTFWLSLPLPFLLTALDPDRTLINRDLCFGHKRTLLSTIVMSALPPIADMCSATGDVRFVPIADIARLHSTTSPSIRLMLSFTSIFPKFSPLKSLRKAVGAFSMPCSMLSFHTSLPSRIHPDRSW